MEMSESGETMSESAPTANRQLPGIIEDDQTSVADIDEEVRIERDDYKDQYLPRVDNDFLDRSSNKCHEAKIGQAVDSTFFSTMRLGYKVQEISSKDPLRFAIASRDEIDVQIILDELGPAATGSISLRDEEGRTALHIAAFSKNVKIITMVLNSYRRHEERQLTLDLSELAEEYGRTIAITSDKYSANGSNRVGKKSIQLSQTSSISEWFDAEKARKMRQLEFRCEVSVMLNDNVLIL